MEKKKPSIKISVGSLYYAKNNPTESGEFNPGDYDTTVNSPVIKSVNITPNEESVVVRASGQDYDTISQSSGPEIEVEVVAFDPTDLAMMKADTKDNTGLMLSGRPAQRPFVAIGFPRIKNDGKVSYEWYPKCKLVENSDEISTKEESFSEQNDTVKFKAYAFNDAGDYKTYVDNEMSTFPEGLTEEKFFTKPILSGGDLTTAISIQEG